jgi:hypothetical protein
VVKNDDNRLLIEGGRERADPPLKKIGRQAHSPGNWVLDFVLQLLPFIITCQLWCSKKTSIGPRNMPHLLLFFFFKKGGRPKPNLHMNDMIHAGISYLHRVPGRAFDILVGSVWHNCCWLKKQLI